MDWEWFFSSLIGDHNYKSSEQIEELLVRAAGNNSNFLLNIGPMPNGEIQEEFVTRLHAVGEWLSRYGDSIYGTRGGPIPPGDWGVTTQKDDKIYVHVLQWNALLLALSPVAKKINSARELTTNSSVEFTQDRDRIVLKVPAATNKQVDRVVVLSVAQ